MKVVSMVTFLKYQRIPVKQGCFLKNSIKLKYCIAVVRSGGILLK
jgi:hypothetical protein